MHKLSWKIGKLSRTRKKTMRDCYAIFSIQYKKKPQRDRAHVYNTRITHIARITYAHRAQSTQKHAQY